MSWDIQGNIGIQRNRKAVWSLHKFMHIYRFLGLILCGGWVLPLAAMAVYNIQISSLVSKRDL